MLNNLSSKTDIIMAIFSLISIIGAILWIAYFNNKNKDKLFNSNYKNIYSIGLENMNENNMNTEKKVDIQMALATENIPHLEEIKYPEPILPSSNTPLEIIIPKEDKKVDIKMSLATEDIPEIDESKFPVPVSEINKEDNKETPVEIKEENLDEYKEETSSDNIDKKESTIEIDEELEMIQDNKNKTSIEEVLKAMQLDLEKQKYAKIDAYEEEQEEEAVISYQELRKKMAMKEEKKQEEKLNAIIKPTSTINIDDYLSYNTKPKEEEKEPVYKELMEEKTDYSSYFFDILDRNESVEKVEDKKDFHKEEPLYFEEKNTVIEEIYEPTNKKSTIDYSADYISPVFGKQKPNIVYNDLTKIRNSKPRRQEINTNYEETDNFLNTLKEFRNNL